MVLNGIWPMAEGAPPLVGAVLAHAEPVLVSTLPAVPGATATAATPPTVSAPPTATFPLASLTMLLTVPEGWMTLMVLSVEMSASY